MCYSSAIPDRTPLLESLGPQYTIQPYLPFYYASGFDHPLMPVLRSDHPFLVRPAMWGLIPAWAADRESALAICNKTLNARSETVFETASFRSAMKNDRCLVLVNGFYEWQHIGKQKIPYFIHMPGKAIFAFAGVAATWKDKATGEVWDTFSIITTTANQLMSEIHNTKKRMPVTLDRSCWPQWLDARTSEHQLRSLMQPLTDGLLQAHPVGPVISGKSGDRNVPAVQDPIKNRDPFGESRPLPELF